MRKLSRDIIADVRSLDKRTTVALLTAVFVLLTLQFKGKSNYWIQMEFVRNMASNFLELQFVGQAAWALTTFVLFGVLPFLVATLVLKMKPSEFGFNAEGFLKHIGVYLLFFAFMAPLIWLASKDPVFQKTYPFAQLAKDRGIWFWRWQVFYFLQFCGLEMFFRGFMVFTLERRFGLHSIFVMTIPYAMIHLHKPMPEAFGAIFAGIILGYMALKTRSFYGGIVLHYAVALTMDLLATSN